ncbi:MAG: DNA polymerase III subunit beta [SAR324 cluster bacterium]|nr:DNA polymerase III subunit beta [SAR324 cluster bacterium]
MEIKIKKELLKDALQNIISIIDKSSVKPILSNFLLKSIEDHEQYSIEFSATDHEISILEYFSAEVIESGSICISAKKLYDICKEFQGDIIHIKSTEQLWIHITSDSSELKLPSVEVGLYPQTVIEELPEKLIISSDELKKCIDATLYASQTNESRRNLMGVCLSSYNGRTRWLSTDGHRLAQAYGTSQIENENFSEVIIPRKALSEVRKAIHLFDESIEISFDEHTLQFSGKSVVFKTRLIEGKFPNCDPIIPKDNPLIAIMDRERLVNALRIVSSITNEKMKPVKFIFGDNKLRIESEKADYGEVSDEMDIDYNNESMQIGFNARYVLDSLNVVQHTQVRIDLKTSMAPGLIRSPENDDCISVIMPLRIEW